ncbi:cyclase family protein [Geobacter sp. DSM 9736]|uniref:cyclase family protein n=1 Tax=Geobacter sp. DSM 9736 TaxID=1277350 RepID=UPI000B5036A9|nr:cyclase family protein [Geobacter sp. DSM 9736]SNB47447.1 Kynurenine formamidase [Geobacter sp. DSM 9736]
MKIHDISVPVRNGMQVYPGDPQVTVEQVASIASGDRLNLSRLVMGSHAGTHMDAPSHFIDSGASVDLLPPELMIGPAVVVEVKGVTEVSARIISRLPLHGTSRLLLKTDNGAFWPEGEFNEDYAHLSEDAARYLVERKMCLVGIDGPSIERFEGSGDVHRQLLGGGVLILEGLDLRSVQPGEYDLLCLPLKVAGGEGAPARALLMERHGSSSGTFDAHTTRWPL